MATMENVKCQTYEAGGDLSAGQFHFVDVASDAQVDLVSSAGGDAVGVLLNKPDEAGKAATVAVSGRVKVVTGVGGLDEGDYVQSDASAQAIAAGSGDYRLGRCVAAAAEGELAEVQLGSNHLAA